MRHTTALFWLGLAALGSAEAQMFDSSGKRIDIFMVDEPPVLDGVLDDDAWAFGTPVTDLHQVSPDEYAEPTEESQILVVYTKDALYVSARMIDKEPDKISAQILRQGDWSMGEDSFSIMLDPFNKGRTGYVFDLTANGVRNQAVYESVTNENWAWRGIWHGETSFEDRGWVAEVEIPFKTLSFDPLNDVWGINFARYIGRKFEHIGWVSANRTQNPSIFGEVGGMSGAEKGIGLDVVPSARIQQAKDFETGVTSESTEPAIDVFYKVTPSLTASMTVNTDFSGTSVDQRQINLTRFGLFFPEQRVFFLQDTDIFEFGRIGGGSNYFDHSTLSRVEKESGRPFFSRRIGLSGSGETIDIDGGGKFTGRAGEWDIGLLGIRQAAFHDLDASDLFVARLARNVLEESSLGVILTDGDPDSDLDNSLAGVDFRYLNSRLSNGRTIEGGLWYQQSDSEGLEDNQSAFGVSLRMPNSEGFRWGVAYKELEENFYPALGFVNRVNVSDLSTDVGYTWYPRGGAFRQVFSGVDYQRIETLQGELQSQVTTLRALEVVSQLGDRVEIHYQLFDEVLDAPFEISEGVTIPLGHYSFDEYCVNYSTAQSRRISLSGYYCGGKFFSGDIMSPGIEATWRPSVHFRLSLGHHISDIELPYGNFRTRLTTLRADVAFTNALYWENIVQYDNVSNSLGINSIFRWVPRAGREVILVVNREFIDYLRDRTFNSVTGDITFKFGYTFRF
jgi:hypothetical protein